MRHSITDRGKPDYTFCTSVLWQGKVILFLLLSFFPVFLNSVSAESTSIFQTEIVFEANSELDVYSSIEDHNTEESCLPLSYNQNFKYFQNAKEKETMLKFKVAERCSQYSKHNLLPFNRFMILIYAQYSEEDPSL